MKAISACICAQNGALMLDGAWAGAGGGGDRGGGSEVTHSVVANWHHLVGVFNSVRADGGLNLCAMKC